MINQMHSQTHQEHQSFVHTVIAQHGIAGVSASLASGALSDSGAHTLLDLNANQNDVHIHAQQPWTNSSQMPHEGGRSAPLPHQGQRPHAQSNSRLSAQQPIPLQLQSYPLALPQPQPQVPSGHAGLFQHQQMAPAMRSSHGQGPSRRRLLDFYEFAICSQGRKVRVIWQSTLSYNRSCNFCRFFFCCDIPSLNLMNTRCSTSERGEISGCLCSIFFDLQEQPSPLLCRQEQKSCGSHTCRTDVFLAKRLSFL